MLFAKSIDLFWFWGGSRGDMGACVEREVLDRVVLFQHQRGFHAGRYCLR